MRRAWVMGIAYAGTGGGNMNVGDQLTMVFRIFLATLLGGIVGYEREMHNRWAGFRTHILVCVGACLIMLTSIHLSLSFTGQANADPGRLAAQVVSGIGFLGAGTILHSASHIRGLTTAANLWMIAGVGLAVGCGLYIPAVATTALAFVVLEYFAPMESRFRTKRIKIPWQIQVTLYGGESAQSTIFELLDDFELIVQNLKMDKEADKAHLTIIVDANPQFDQGFFLTKIRQIIYVVEVGIECLKEGHRK